jgi:hypothetical protein
VYWTCLHRHPAGPGQRQQALRGEHLDVALRLVQPPDGVYCWGGEDQGRAAQGEQDQGSWDEEAPKRGFRSSWTGRRRRRIWLNTGTWYHMSYHDKYHVWYQRCDVKYDIWYVADRLWYHSVGLWYHKLYHSVYHIWYHTYDVNYDIIVLTMVS